MPAGCLIAARDQCITHIWRRSWGRSAARPAVLLPGGIRPGRRQAQDRLAGVPGDRRGAGRRDARRRAGAAGPDPAQGVRRHRRGVGHAGGSRRGGGHRPGQPGHAGRAAAVHRHVPGAGGAEPAGRPVLQGRVRGLVENDRCGPVHQDPRHRAGSPAVLGRDARRHAGAAGGDLPQDRGEDRAVRRRGRILGRAGHDQLRHVHRHRQRQGAGRAAGQGQAETLGPAAGRAGPGRHPGRRDPADLARLPRQQARRHPVPRHDRPAARASTRRCAPQPVPAPAPRT